VTCDKGVATPTPCAPLSAIASEPRDEKQQCQSYGNNAVRPDRTAACRPREHQDFEKRHEFVRPQQSCQSECETQLDNKAQPQIVHGNDSNERIPFHWNAKEELGKVTTVTLAGGTPAWRALLRSLNECNRDFATVTPIVQLSEGNRICRFCLLSAKATRWTGPRSIESVLETTTCASRQRAI
jgi:hypothetical protein